LTRKLRILDLVLVLSLAALGWQMRREWVDAHAREQAFLRVRIGQKPPTLLAPLAKVDPLSALSYAPMVQNNLFSKDRNPQVIIDPPAPVPEIPVPAFPVARGVMLWPGAPPTVVLSAKGSMEQKGYHPGDRFGDWTIKSVDNRYITLEWNGKEFKKRLDELMDRSNYVAEAPSAPAAAAAAPANSSTDLSKNLNGKKEGPGIDVGGGNRGCINGDTTPSGAVVDGWKKVMSDTPFGKSCTWVPAR